VITVVRHPRARRVSLRVDAVTGAARLTLPPRESVKKALAWAETQAGWLAAQRARVPEPSVFADGAVVPFGDETLTIAWVSDAPRRVERVGNRLVLGGPAETVGRRVALWLRGRALDALSADTAEYAAKAGVSVARVAVGDARRRWGSCASTGTIRYSWRLIMAPAAVRRATAAHEVAHRVHMNHGPAFHALVAALYGAEPIAERRWLREHGAALHAWRVD
jgi:predicted metal-dependent hydrolase